MLVDGQHVFAEALGVSGGQKTILHVARWALNCMLLGSSASSVYAILIDAFALYQLSNGAFSARSRPQTHLPGQASLYQWSFPDLLYLGIL